VNGIGLRSAHYRAFLETQPRLDFIEVHSENFFGRDARGIGGQPRAILEAVRTDYSLSLHGIGLSLGSDEPMDRTHLQQLKILVDRYQPMLVSDHLAWVGMDGIYLNDLLPLPYTEQAFAVVERNVQIVQEAIGRTLLIENPSRYLSFAESTLSEPEFLNRLAHSTGCGILLDINNVFVSAHNLQFDPLDYLCQLNLSAVREFHLAGFTRAGNVLIDTHNRPVADEVWQLFATALGLARPLTPIPTLIEWDTELPDLSVLTGESDIAQKIAASAGRSQHVHVV
jgi:uncharacterized protein (UPF0276 family)